MTENKQILTCCTKMHPRICVERIHLKPRKSWYTKKQTVREILLQRSWSMDYKVKEIWLEFFQASVTGDTSDMGHFDAVWYIENFVFHRELSPLRLPALFPFVQKSKPFYYVMDT